MSKQQEAKTYQKYQNRYEFTVFGIPIPKARAVVTNKFSKKGKRITFTPDRTKIAELDFIRQASIYAPVVPIQGPIALSVTFHMPLPKSWPKWKKLAAIGGKIRPTSTPDIDNLLKLVQDAMNKIFWNDDSQIVEVQTAKYYSDEPRIGICLEELNLH